MSFLQQFDVLYLYVRVWYYQIQLLLHFIKKDAVIIRNLNFSFYFSATLATIAEIPVTTSKPNPNTSRVGPGRGSVEPLSSNGAGSITLLTGVAIGIPVLVLILLIVGIVIYKR